MGTTERRHRALLLRAGPVAALAVFAVFALLVGTAWAAWSAGGAGSGRVGSQSVPQGNTPVASLSVRDVTVSWAAVTLSGGTPVAGYRLARYPSTGTTAQSLTSCTGVIAALSCTETSVPVGSWRYTVTPAQGSWTGAESGYSATVVVTGPPALSTLEMFDGNGNGTVDRVVATFDKTLAAYSAGTAPWTLANVPSGGSLDSVSVAGAAATLTLTEGAGAADTAAGSFTVALAADANGIRGTDGQQSSFAATAPTDKAGPAAVALSSAGGTGTIPGRLQAGDKLSVTLSEALGASVTLSTSVTLSMADPTTLTTDQLTVPTLFDGPRSTGTDGYLNRNNTTASFAASTVTISADRKTVTVTVGSTCGGNGCNRLRTVATAAPVSVLLDAGLVDAAGNSPTTIARDISAILF